MKPERLKQIPNQMRRELILARHNRGWSQAELGKRLGIPQMHVSAIETGKIAPRFDTLLDFVRTLDRDLMMVPRSLVPAVQALIRDQGKAGDNSEDERSLYAFADAESDEEQNGDET
jgi:HTH-type transcriptional regulator/antitoxin HipB